MPSPITLVGTSVRGGGRHNIGQLTGVHRSGVVDVRVDHTGVVRQAGRAGLLSVGGGSRHDGRRVFASASDAVGCALGLQRELAGGPVRPRIGVHAGEAGAGYPGAAPGHCDYLADSPAAGQVVLSQEAADLAAGRLPPRCALTDLGWHRLPDLGPSERLWQLSHPDLRSQFPPLRALDPRRHNLPAQLTSFVGRRGALGEVTGLLHQDRLVTLTGSGGCGKTRLALHAAAGRVGSHPDGVWPVELAPLADPGQVAAAIAAALSVREPGAAGDPAALSAAIGQRAPLLVLDNCEHLARRCAEVAEQLLLACPRLRILACAAAAPVGVRRRVHRSRRRSGRPGPGGPRPRDRARPGARPARPAGRQVADPARPR
jgi:hypothetical protein